MKRILFVCKGNRFRSQIAEGFFNKLNKNKKYKASSCGVVQGDPVPKPVRKIAHKYRLKLTKPKTINEKFLRKQDIIVTVADNIPFKVFLTEKKAGKVIKAWNIKDVLDGNIKKVDKTSLIIKKKVEKLLKELK